MKLFKKSNIQTVQGIKLPKEYKFMYENFVVSTQQKLYLLLEEQNGIIDVLSFDFSVYKYGYPNDEVGHPLMKYGLGIYGFFEVKNSLWIDEMKKRHSTHDQHSNNLFEETKHYIAKFKDVTLEVLAKGYAIERLTKIELINIVSSEIDYLKID